MDASDFDGMGPSHLYERSKKMDPNWILSILRSWANGEDSGMDESDAMETFQSLDNWLTTGGFPPNDWVN